MKGLRTLGNRVLLQEDTRNKFYDKSGIIETPYDYQRKSMTGLIIQMGHLVGKECGLCVGDRAIVHRYAGAGAETYQEVEYRFVNPNQILAIIRDNVLSVLGDRYLITDIPREDKIGSGILYKPDNVREEFMYGLVVSSGKDTIDVLNKGDKILFNKKSGIITEIEGVQYRLIEAEAIMGVCDNNG
jgi:co-chaperonin GroES (HSP10)